MKPFIAAVCLALLLPALSACTGTRMPAVTPEDFSVTYHWDNGSLPPPYHYELTVTIGARSEGRLTLQLGYSPEDEHPLTETFEVSDEQLDELYRVMVDQEVFTRRWTPDDDPPVGGEVEWIEAQAGGEEVRIPAYLEREADQNAATAVYAAVRGLVPDSLWDWVAEYQSEYETRE